MHKKAFTLIELMVTAAIIVVMAVVAIPAFSSYGAKNAFKLQATEIQSLMNQASIMAKNPEQGVTRYFIKINSSDTSLYKTNENSGNLIKKIVVPSTYTITPAISGKIYLVCDSPSNFCCPATNLTGTCASAPILADNNFLTISDSDSGLSSTINIFSNPFRVESQ